METIKYKALSLETRSISSGTVSWQSPSNIALVKYWGKKDRQIPANPSISFTLKNACTKTEVKYKKGQGELRFFFEEKENNAFKLRIEKYIDSISDIYPFLKELDLEIHSKNTFPHSAGIASSASAMSALCLCFCSIEQKLFGNLKNQNDFLRKASYLSRLASGSACRSVYPIVAEWGKFQSFKESSNEVAIPLESKIADVFKTFQNSILIVSSKTKEVSSTIGHELMNTNIYANTRFQQASNHLEFLYNAMCKGNLDTFIEIVEMEALTLHALMMTSSPSFVLMQANSLEIIHRIRAFRAETKLPICFTLDAGPNVHVLYPKVIEKEVRIFINENLKPFCENEIVIEDEVGEGPVLLS